MEWSCPWTLATTAGTITFNATSGDAYVLDPARCSGDMPEVRSVIDPAPRDDGAIIHDVLFGKWPFVLAGVMHCATGTASARNTMENNLDAALRAILTADGTLTQTPSGASSHYVLVRLEVPLGTTSWEGGVGNWVKSFVFGVVSAATDWT